MPAKSLDFCRSITVMLLTPSEAMESVTELVTASPTHMMPMTEPMPMMMPSMVSSARILLARRPLMASTMFSHMPFIYSQPPSVLGTMRPSEMVTMRSVSVASL